MELKINGKKQKVDVDPSKGLLYVLRDNLFLTGSKYGCGEGQCGACTVLLDGVPVRSCITPAGSAAGKDVTTIEGLEKEGQLHAVQEAFLAENAFQCGYCTSGMIMAAVGLLEKNPNPSRREIVRSMQGNICRCGTYPRIIAAIERVVKGSEELEKSGKK